MIIKEFWAQSGFANTDLDLQLKSSSMAFRRLAWSVSLPTGASSPPGASTWNWAITFTLVNQRLEYNHSAPQILSTPRTRVPSDPRLKCAGKAQGKPTSLQRLAPRLVTIQ